MPRTSLKDALFWMNLYRDILSLDETALRRIRDFGTSRGRWPGEFEHDARLFGDEIERVMIRLRFWEEIVDRSDKRRAPYWGPKSDVSPDTPTSTEHQVVAPSAAMDSDIGTAERLARAQNAALELAEIVDDLVRDMETIALKMPARAKRTHELALATRARGLARAVRGAVADTRTDGALERRRRVRRRQERLTGSVSPVAAEQRPADTERRKRMRRRPKGP